MPSAQRAKREIPKIFSKSETERKKERERERGKLDAIDFMALCATQMFYCIKNFLRALRAWCNTKRTWHYYGCLPPSLRLPCTATATLIMTADYSVGGVAGLLLALLVGGIVSAVSPRCCRRLTCVDKRLTGDTAESHIILALNLVWIPFGVR